ncbi:MAG TPA: hypothetical protein VIJ72_07145 [Rhizomicrobium sp.]
MDSEQFSIPDGLTEIHHELPLVIAMIERTARWVHPRAFRALPIWCPDTARGRPRFDAKWSHQLVNGRDVPKVEENIRAAKALVEAMGIPGKKPSNWTVCHIWGYDDEAFAASSNIVKDPHFYSCVGNMVLLPTPLKGFTDAVPEIKKILRTCAYYLYGWACEHGDARAQVEKIRAGDIPDGYPKQWPTATRQTLPKGTAPFTPRVEAAIAKRRREIAERLKEDSYLNYPRNEVRDVLSFWNVEI